MTMTTKEAEALKTRIYDETAAEYVEIVSAGDDDHYLVSARYPDITKTFSNAEQYDAWRREATR